MASVIEVTNLTKQYREITALDNVSLAIEPDRIYGLLGRNGAGKSTLMSIITAQAFATSGTVRVFGEEPFERASVLSQICFVRESQKYPDDFKPGQAFLAASLFFENWDQAFADKLAAEFKLPMNRTIKKLSRGQLSAVGVVIGLASRAPITFFDEPYLGLDAVARQIFYDRLLEDYAEHPRTVILSSHLIDEVANLLEHVILIDEGKVLINAAAEEIRGMAVTLIGDTDPVTAFTSDREIIHAESLGRVTSVTILGEVSAAERDHLRAAGVEMAPVSLQQLVVRLTQSKLTQEVAA